MKKFTGLGRGLDALIDTSHVDTNGGSSISEIELSAIIANPDQPRRTFDEEALQELADSIREHGVISRNVRLSEAPSHGVSVLEYDPYSKGAQNYTALAREVILRNKKR